MPTRPYSHLQYGFLFSNVIESDALRDILLFYLKLGVSRFGFPRTKINTILTRGETVAVQRDSDSQNEPKVGRHLVRVSVYLLRPPSLCARRGEERGHGQRRRPRRRRR
jgi:hypothetical protein